MTPDDDLPALIRRLNSAAWNSGESEAHDSWKRQERCAAAQDAALAAALTGAVTLRAERDEAMAGWTNANVTKLEQSLRIAELARERDEARAQCARMRWISVDEGLPIEGTAVLLWVPGWCVSNMALTGWLADEPVVTWKDFDGDVISVAVTHWMPLPPSPITPKDNHA